MTASLSIILVTRRAGEFIEDTIAQARAAEAEFGADVVAIDADSTDGTWEALKAQPQWDVQRQRSIGLAAARNEAIERCRGEVVAFLDADDRWLPGKTAVQLQALHDPAIDVVSCQLRRVDLTTDVVEAGEPHPAMTPSGCLFRRDVFDRVGGFDPTYTIAADHEWFVRAAGLRTEILADVLLHKGMHSANLSHDRSTYRRELAQVLRTQGQRSRFPGGAGGG